MFTQDDLRRCADMYPVAHRLLRRRHDPHDLPGPDRLGAQPHPDPVLRPARRQTIRLARPGMLSRRLPLGPRLAAHL